MYETAEETPEEKWDKLKKKQADNIAKLAEKHPDDWFFSGEMKKPLYQRTGWIIWGIATFIVGGFTFIEDEDGEHHFHKYRLIAWIAVVFFGIVMFVLQNIYIYLY